MNARIVLCAGGVLLCGTASMLVIGPKRVAGQTDRPAAGQPQESETVRQLRMLYAKEGKQMPEMNIQKLPMVTHSPGTQNLRPVDPNDSSSSSPLKYLKRIFSLGRKTSPPPAYHPQQYRQPAAPARYASQPRSVPPAAAAPRYAAPRYAAPPVRTATQQRREIPVATAANTRTVPSPKKSAEDEIPVLIDDRQQSRQPATAPARPFPASTADDRPSLPKPAPVKSVAKPVPQPGPFTGKSLKDDDSAPKVAGSASATNTPPAKPSAPPAELEIRSKQQLQSRQRNASHPLAEPRILANPGPAAAVAKASSQPSSREEKLRRIVQRRGLAGFRGFCPVVLRDDRELADAKIPFQSEYRKKNYYFSSATAKATFDRAPEKYAPASSGNDVVQFADDLKQAEGSLEHALWYRGKLYFFAGGESLRKFIAEPAKYASEE